MIYHILDHHYNTLTLIDTNAEKGIVASNDQHTVHLVRGTRLNTLDMDIYKRTGPHIDDFDPNSPLETTLIKEGCYIVFVDDNNNKACVMIQDISNETEEVRTIHCEDLGMELINGSASQFESKKAQYVDYYVNRELYDAGWQIGINELAGNKKKLVETTGDETPLSRLQTVCEAFDCEMVFTVDFRNTKIYKKVVNIYFKIGSDKTGKVMYSGVDLVSMTKTISMANVVTALRDTNKGFDDLAMGDGRFYTSKGESIVYDRVANAEYGSGNTSKERYSGWRMGLAESTKKTQVENYNEIRNQLEERAQPEFSAEVTILYKDSDFEVGDYITFVDEEFNPPLRLKARIIEKNINRSDQSQNKVVISNIEQLKSRINADVLAKQREKIDLTSPYIVKLIPDNGTSFVDGESKTTTITAHVYKNGQEITDTLAEDDLLWFKTDKEGNHDTTWEAAAKGVSVVVNDTQVTEGSASIKCTLIKFQNYFVQAIYFINGLRDIARKILKLQSADTVTSIHISDTHYASDTVVRDDLENYGRSNEHIKNVAELTNFMDIDYVVHDGDVHDGGSASKDVAANDFKACVSSLGLCSCPYFVAWGNHDSNALGDKRSDARRKDIINYKPNPGGETRMIGTGAQQITHQQMYDIATRPSKIFNIVENEKDFMGYYYYDVPDKKVRVIILNTNDTPQVLDSDGYLKYLDSFVAGYRQAQISWFYQTIKDTPEDVTVCIYQHYPFGTRYQATPGYCPYNYEMIDGIINSFVTGGKYSGSYSENKDFKASISCDFTGRKGKLAFLAHGHTHKDKISVDTNGTHDYCIGCSVSRPKKDMGDRPIGELTEDLWDVIVLNTKTRHVDLLRYGQGSDRSFDY